MHSMMNTIFNDPFGIMGLSGVPRTAIMDGNHRALGHHDNLVPQLPLMPFRFPIIPPLARNDIFSEFVSTS